MLLSNMFTRMFLAVSFTIAVKISTAERTMGDLTIPEYCSSICNLLTTWTPSSPNTSKSYGSTTTAETTTSDVTLGLLVPLTSKPTKCDDITNLLKTGLQLVKAEPNTLQWYAVKFASNNTDEPETFGIFDTFASQAGRDTHLNGKVAGALLDNADALFSVPPPIQKIDVLAALVRPISDSKVDDKAGLAVGLQVLVEAKDPNATRDFLRGALSLVQNEPNTLTWYAIEFPGTNKFGIVDFFADEASRELHLNGKVAEALFASADKLFVAAPEIVKLDVLFANI